MKRVFLFFCAMVFSIHLIASTQTQVIHSIQVHGLQRISKETVLNALPFKVGDKLTASASDEAIKSLYKTGFFSSVNMDEEGSTLVIKVIELPVITNIQIHGAQEVKKEDIEKMLQKLGITVGQALQANQLHEVQTILQKNYEALGIYGAHVGVDSKALSHGRVMVIIEIHEGHIAGVKGIRFVGNEHFAQSVLLHQFQTKTSHLWSPIFHDDRFSDFKLDADLEALRSFYYNHGYLDFRVTSKNVSLTDDGQAVYITIHVDEGPLYTISRVRLAGNMLQYAKALRGMLTIKEGQVFSREKITTSTAEMTHFLSNQGYAFADVKISSKLDRDKHQVALDLLVEPGHLVYIHAIRFSGNNITEDKVLRREMRQLEGARFSYADIEESKRRLRNLGYVSDVEMTTKRVPGRPNQVDLDFKIKEKVNASINFQLGYSTAYKFLYGITWKQKNVLGSGKDFNIALERSKYMASASVDYTNPYFTSSGVSHNIGASYQKTTPEKVDLGNYRLDEAAVYTGFGFPITEYQTMGLSLRLANTDLHTNANTPTEITSFTNRYGHDFKMMTLGLNWSYSHYDQAIFPTSGWQHYLGASVSNNYSGRSLHYFRTDYSMGYYHPINHQLTLHARAELRYGDGFSGTDKLPPYLNYFSGGLGSVAGYEPNDLGPKNSNGDPLGGSAAIDGGISVIIPAGFSEDARFSVFVDGGNVFKNSFDFGDLRYSAGVGLVWNIGGMMPLQFALSKAINPGGRNTRLFDFSIGRSF